MLEFAMRSALLLIALKQTNIYNADIKTSCFSAENLAIANFRAVYLILHRSLNLL